MLTLDKHISFALYFEISPFLSFKYYFGKFNILPSTIDIIKFYEPFDNLAKRLPPNFFLSHKSYIVNLKCIHKVIPINKTSLEVSFINFQETATLSKSLEKDFLYRFYRTKRF
ncbi:MAG: LytTR family DNA-binding domain-containing protein [Paraclostridium sp.]|uniref:LytTR family DNA-binding domain-containing protein n=1 Tax=Paraclostridium sp. TaxID=2023273 RepID=UPI003F3FD239